MNSPEEKLMRKRLLAKQDLSGNSWADTAAELKEFEDLDQVAGYVTLEEMTELLDQQREIGERARAGELSVVSYSLMNDYSIRCNIMRLLCFPNSWFRK